MSLVRPGASLLIFNITQQEAMRWRGTLEICGFIVYSNPLLCCVIYVLPYKFFNKYFNYFSMVFITEALSSAQLFSAPVFSGIPTEKFHTKLFIFYLCCCGGHIKSFVVES